MKTVTSTIIHKSKGKGLQPLNGNLMLFDFPFERPTEYNFWLANGRRVEVSEATYEQYKVGDQFTTEFMEFSDYLLAFGAFVLFVLIVVGFLLSVYL